MLPEQRITRDGGRSFRRLEVGGRSAVTATVLPNGLGYAWAHDDRLWRSTDGGRKWRRARRSRTSSRSRRRRPAPGRCATAASAHGSCAARTAGVPGISDGCASEASRAPRSGSRSPTPPTASSPACVPARPGPTASRSSWSRRTAAGPGPSAVNRAGTGLQGPVGRAVARVRDAVADLRQCRRRGRGGDRGPHQHRRRPHLHAAVAGAAPRRSAHGRPYRRARALSRVQRAHRPPRVHELRLRGDRDRRRQGATGARSVTCRASSTARRSSASTAGPATWRWAATASGIAPTPAHTGSD